MLYTYCSVEIEVLEIIHRRFSHAKTYILLYTVYVLIVMDISLTIFDVLDY